MSGIENLMNWVNKNSQPLALPELPEAETCLASLEDELNSCDQRTKRFDCFLSYMSCLDDLIFKTPISTFNGTGILPIKFDGMRKCKNLLRKCF